MSEEKKIGGYKDMEKAPDQTRDLVPT